MNIARRAIRRTIHIMAQWGIISPKTTVKWLHTVELKRVPNIKHPADFNEKLMWLYFNSDTTEWSKLTDKYEVRDYVARNGYADILIPLIGLYNHPEDIDYTDFPQKFVIKTSNGCAQTLFVNDKTSIDKDDIARRLKKWQAKGYGAATGETHYLSIPKRLVVEEKLECANGELPTDYKFMCFNGKPVYCLVCTEREEKRFSKKSNLFDAYTWTEVDNSVNPHHRGDAKSIERPANLERMIEIASKLSKPFKFLRVDLYEVNDKVYFGELTFTPAGFRSPTYTRDMLMKMGELIDLDS